MDVSNTGRCKECGILSLRAEKGSGVELIETPEYVREHGEKVPLTLTNCLEVVPHCAIGAFDLRKQFRDFNGSPKDAFLEVIQKDRKCGLFCQWRETYTPKEHVEMTTAKQFQDQEDRRIEREKEWESKQERENRRLQIIQLLISKPRRAGGRFSWCVRNTVARN